MAGCGLVLALATAVTGCGSSASHADTAGRASTRPATSGQAVSPSTTRLATAAASRSEQAVRPTVTPPVTSTTRAMPQLGLKGAVFEGTGLGEVKPSEINFNGDPTSYVTGIAWTSWGGTQAVGQGMSTYVAPGQMTAQGHRETATVVAFDPGRCSGTYAYQAVEWYFPEHGEQFSPTQYRNVCTGAYVDSPR